MNLDTSYCERKIIDIHGQTGVAWLKQLPSLLAECAAHWSLDIQPPFPIASYNYVAPAIGGGGQQLVIKLGVPHDELWSEIDALRVIEGRGATRLLDAHRERGVMLLERVLPGHSLWSVDDEAERIDALIDVMRRLWHPVPAGYSFRPVADLARGLERLRAEFDGGYGPFPPARIDRAMALFRELAGKGSSGTLIHGDMNPGNILHSERQGWVAIDPKGYAGHPFYDVATYLNDPPEGLSAAELKSLQVRRVSLLAEGMGARPGELLAWAEAHAVLSCWWSYEDHGRGWEAGLELAGIYETMQRTA